ncbi:hypothetical protein BBD42_04115 [Paenibacillus sp. BIHB 4019]|uniref:Uncharacterized protein n=1 Tax=Paenibacillus sp. BIHB 4019 TaxID=1870819 RepID=A0A1B2DDF4_9BACL|nr:hypothetical protein BBD42_04115 [Paenibacillus sp. BIHB 4019]
MTLSVRAYVPRDSFVLFVSGIHIVREEWLGGHSSRYFNRIQGMAPFADSGAANALEIAILTAK